MFERLKQSGIKAFRKTGLVFTPVDDQNGEFPYQKSNHVGGEHLCRHLVIFLEEDILKRSLKILLKFNRIFSYYHYD